MSNANETMAPVPQGDPATEPIDLAQAFRALNKANREAAQAMVVNGEGVRDSQGGSQLGEPAESDADGIQEGEGTAAAVDVSDGGEPADDGGSSDSIDAIDFNAYKQQMLRDIQKNAQNQVRKEFNDQNIGYYSMAELTIRDEQTGRVMYRNPDVQDERDPNYFFKSRKELADFCDSWNKGVDYEYRKAVNERAGQLMQQEAPKARLMDFWPKWQAMDNGTRSVFDALLEGHEIRDANGKEIGYDVNLYSVAAQAERIAKSFGGGVQQQASQDDGADKAPVSSEPALDAKTGNGKAKDENDIESLKNVGEALKMYDRINKKGK